MLADEVLAERGNQGPMQRMYDAAAAAIKQFQRFALDREILVAATNVSNSMPSSIMQGLPLCRLPFPPHMV